MFAKAVMNERAVQYGVADAADADVGPAAPGFRASWQSKAELKQRVLAKKNVPKDAELYFWDGQLWLEWEDPTDLPGPEDDPLRIKVVRPQSAGELFPPRCAQFEHTLQCSALLFIVPGHCNC